MALWHFEFQHGFRNIVARRFVPPRTYGDKCRQTKDFRDEVQIQSPRLKKKQFVISHNARPFFTSRITLRGASTTAGIVQLKLLVSGVCPKMFLLLILPSSIVQSPLPAK